jgi:hypothetical protein
MGVSSLCFFSFKSVKGWFLSCPMVAISRVYTETRLKTSGNSSSRSFQIDRRFFSPLIQTNHHFEDPRWPNSEWMIRNHRWCVSVCISESASHWCCICPKVWIGRSSSVLSFVESSFCYPQGSEEVVPIRFLRFRDLVSSAVRRETVCVRLEYPPLVLGSNWCFL